MLYRRIIIKPEDGYFQDISDVRPQHRDNYLLHILLFLATVLTTTGVGAIMSGHNPFTGIKGFMSGFPFSLTLLCILGVHEFAHYFTARFWDITVTLPYFLPAPFIPIGTFGAVIKMKSSIPTRRALIDVGAAGPIAGFIVAVAACIIGLQWSEVTTIPTAPLESSLMLGDSLIFKFFQYMLFGSLPENATVYLHPVAYAGWLGLFVTALNLIPLGQLDGGHVLFAISPRIHELMRKIRIPLLLLMGLIFWQGWYVWALLSLFFGRNHPYPNHMETSIGPVRTFLAVLSLVIFVLCITPTPVKVG
ncbi:site-2 protease family protein [bacterium]|nr:site-2 protease family protein [bacterium]